MGAGAFFCSVVWVLPPSFVGLALVKVALKLVAARSSDSESQRKGIVATFPDDLWTPSFVVLKFCVSEICFCERQKWAFCWGHCQFSEHCLIKSSQIILQSIGFLHITIAMEVCLICMQRVVENCVRLSQQCRKSPMLRLWAEQINCENTMFFNKIFESCSRDSNVWIQIGGGLMGSWQHSWMKVS